MGGAMAAITAVFSVIALLLELWAKAAPKRREEEANEATQRGRLDLQGGDAGPVAVRIDRLLAPEGIPADSHAGGQGDLPEGGAGDTAGRLAALGISVVETAGEGRKL